jgi:hypothetical protein
MMLSLAFSDSSMPPLLSVSQSGSEKQSCTCAIIVHRVLASLTWGGSFTMHIICVSNATLARAYNLHTTALSSASDHVITAEDQEGLFWDMKGLCQCCDVENLDLDVLDDQHNDMLARCQLIKVSKPDPSATASVDEETFIEADLLLARELEEQINGGMNAFTNAKIRRVIKKKLAEHRPRSPTRQKHNDTAYIYRLASEHRSGELKIGFSAEHPEIRAKQPRGKCKQTTYVMDYFEVPMASVRKVEQLVHAELFGTCQLTICECKQRHREWFAIDLRIARQVIKRWMCWMQQNPYDHIGGMLKPHWEATVANKARIAKLLPAIDVGLGWENTWQQFTEANGSKLVVRDERGSG